MVLLTFVSMFSIGTQAASVRYYQTKYDNIPVWTEPASNKTSSTSKKKIVREKGRVLKVIGETINSSGNKWYQLNNGYWVYDGNVTKHSHYYVGGICTSTGCGYEYPLNVEGFSAKVCVTNSSGAKIWSRPYSNNSSHITTYGYGTELTVVAKVKNVNSNGNPDNLWLKLDNGYWVYSGNVTRQYTVKYSANGGSGAPSSQKFLSGSSVVLSIAKPTQVGYIFKGWATSSSSSTVSYNAGSTYSEKKKQNSLCCMGEVQPFIQWWHLY